LMLDEREKPPLGDGGLSGMSSASGLDTSEIKPPRQTLEETKIHVLDEAGGRVWRGKCASHPNELETTICKHASGAVRIGRGKPSQSCPTVLILT
jgi:hypothetical protein